MRARELLRQGCEANNLRILKGSVGKDHIHMLLSCPTTIAPSEIAQKLKGRTSKILQEEFPELKKKILGTAYVGERIFLWNGGRS